MERCDGCKFAKVESVDMDPSETVVICRRFPQMMRKSGDQWCGEWKEAGRVVLEWEAA